MGRKKLLLELPDDLRSDLDAFCEAHYGAPAARILREALRRFIDDQVKAEPELRARYIEARSRPQGRPSEPILLVKPRVASQK
jgi:hypothetical protein